MRLLHLHIDGFGKIRDLAWEGLPKGLVIVTGDNEVGKTTCLSFIRDVLFGFRDGRSAENNYLPADGGRYGGRLTFVSDRLGEFVIERRPGKKGGAVSVSFADGRRGGEEVLPEILGATTRDVFKNVYAFSLLELQTMDTLKSEAVKGVLYGATLGLSTLNLPSALLSIDSIVGSLYKPGARTIKPQINRKLADLEQKKSDLREARKDMDRYDRASLEVLEVERRIGELKIEIAATREKKEKATTLIRLWDDWLTLADLERALQALSEHVDVFPEDGIRRLDGLLEKIEQAGQLLRDLRIECDADKNEARSLPVNDVVLAQSSLIKELRSRRQVYLNDCANLVTATHRLESVQGEIRRLLGDLGGEWKEEAILAVDRSLFTREAIFRKQKELEERASERRNRASLVELKGTELEAAIRDEEEARKLLAGMGTVVAEADEPTLRSLQNGRDQFASVVRDLPQMERQIGEERGRLLSGIREINAAWNESDVLGFDCSMGVRQTLQRIEGEITQAGNGIATTVNALGEAQRELNAEEQRLREATARMDHLGEPPSLTKARLEDRRSSLRALRAALMQKEKLEGRLSYEDFRLTEAGRRRDEYIQQGHAAAPLSLRPFCLVLAAAAAAAYLLLLLPITGDVPFYAGTLFLLVASALYLSDSLLRRRLAQKANNWAEKTRLVDAEIAAVEGNRGDLGDLLAGLADRIREMAASLSLEGTIAIGEVDLMEAKTETEAEQLREWETCQRQHNETSARVETLRRGLERLEEKSRGLKDDLNRAQEEWAGYLKETGLPADLTPRAANIVFARIENLRREIEHLRDLEARRDRMQQTRQDYCQLAMSVPSLRGVIEQDQSMNALSAVDSLLKETRETEALQRRRDAVADTFEDRVRRRQSLAKDVEIATAALENACRQEAATLASWGDWLAVHGLNKEISPSIALEAFAAISDCVARIGEKERLEEEISRLRSSKDSYLALGRSLFTALAEVDPPDEKLLPLLDRISEEHDKSGNNRIARVGLERKIASLSEKISAQEEVLSGHRSQIDRILAAAGVSGEDEFRRRGRLFEERKQILAGIVRAETSMRKVSGEEDICLLRKELEGLNREEMKLSESEYQDKLQDLEGERESFRQRKAELNQLLARLASADDIARLRSEEEAIVEEIRTSARQWGSYTLARALLSQARIRYEQEQQPKVINDAGRFFREMTGGRYEKVVAPMGGEDIEVVTDRGEIKRPEILSRGTEEQLYLAIRFAYITNHSAHSESLPVIMDDVLVNFDPKRTDNAIRAVLELAETHQVLYFTCHPETVDRCRQYRPDVAVFSLGGH